MAEELFGCYTKKLQGKHHFPGDPADISAKTIVLEVTSSPGVEDWAVDRMQVGQLRGNSCPPTCIVKRSDFPGYPADISAKTTVLEVTSSSPGVEEWAVVRMRACQLCSNGCP